MSISMLTDHLQRNASDYEAYNLLLKCFYLTDRFEAGESLASTLLGANAPNDCFRNNQLLCRLLSGRLLSGRVPNEPAKIGSREAANPFIVYNLAVATEKPRAWQEDKPQSLKSKFLFEEYQFGTAGLAGKKNISWSTLPTVPGTTRRSLS